MKTKLLILIFAVFLILNSYISSATFIYLGYETSPHVSRGILIQEMQEENEVLDNGDLSTVIRVSVFVTKDMTKNENGYYTIHFRPVEGYKLYMPPLGKIDLLNYYTCFDANQFTNCPENTTNMTLINTTNFEYIFNISILPTNSSYPQYVFLRYLIKNPLIVSNNYEKILSIGSQCSAFPDPQTCRIRKVISIPIDRYVIINAPKEGTLELSGYFQFNETKLEEYKYWKILYEKDNITESSVIVLKDIKEEEITHTIFSSLDMIFRFIIPLIFLILGTIYGERIKKYIKKK